MQASQFKLNLANYTAFKPSKPADCNVRHWLEGLTSEELPHANLLSVYKT